MNAFKDLLSSVDPSAANSFSTSASVSRLASGSPKPTPRPVRPANATPEVPLLKRKASGPVDGAQSKIQRKDLPAPPGHTNGPARPGSAPAGAKSALPASETIMPYRGTAGLGASKATNPLVKKPVSSNGQAVPAKVPSPMPRPPAPKSAGNVSGTTAAPAKKPGGYLAMLQKAKEKDSTKPAAVPIKHEPTKIMTKKDREQARLAAKAAGKGKKPLPVIPTKATEAKIDLSKEKRKPADLGYQGTARPAKKPIEVGYKGTARPAAAAASASKPGGALAAKKKPQATQNRHDGYADWSDLDDIEDEEEDYESDVSSDMEGGIWDLEKEENEALKAAKREDAEALAEENELKRQKEERKRKLQAMSKAAAARRKF